MSERTLSFSTANGDTTAYVVTPESDEKKAVLVIQEWWGVNDHIKDIVNRYASEGFIAIAPDLYRGKIATNAEDASKMMHDLALEDGIDTIKNAMAKASEELGVSEFGITGYCMGGTYALRAACELDNIKAAAPFYGDIPDEDILKNLDTPTVFISGTKDQWINTEKVEALEDAADTHDLPLESVKYEADHAFFNDTRPEVYDADAAKDAWQRVVTFFKSKL